MCTPVNACHPSVNQENYPSTGLSMQIANVFKTDSDSCKNKTDSDSCITKRNFYNTKLLIMLLLRFLR